MVHLEQDEDSQYRLITKPAFGKDPWDHDYYDFIETADEELVPKGTISERDGTDPHEDALWYVVDGGEEYLSRYDGTSWVNAKAEALDHGNEVHDENYATTTDVEDKADDPHDNTQHSEDYATSSEVEDKADDPHGNAAHTETYLTSSDIDGVDVVYQDSVTVSAEETAFVDLDNTDTSKSFFASAFCQVDSSEVSMYFGTQSNYDTSSISSIFDLNSKIGVLIVHQLDDDPVVEVVNGDTTEREIFVDIFQV